MRDGDAWHPQKGSKEVWENARIREVYEDGETAHE
jgi:hypothetical protein